MLPREWHQGHNSKTSIAGMWGPMGSLIFPSLRVPLTSVCKRFSPASSTAHNFSRSLGQRSLYLLLPSQPSLPRTLLIPWEHCPDTGPPCPCFGSWLLLPAPAPGQAPSRETNHSREGACRGWSLGLPVGKLAKVLKVTPFAQSSSHTLCVALEYCRSTKGHQALKQSLKFKEKS